MLKIFAKTYMIINSQGKIAYHAYQIREDGLWYVQYDFDNKTVVFEYKVRDYVVQSFCSSA